MDKEEEGASYQPADFHKQLSDSISGMDLTSFLSRPVNIHTLTWDRFPVVANLATIDPWTLFLNNDRIKYKLNNFAYLRGNLHVKIMLSSSPFVYGAAVASYLPLPNFKASTSSEAHGLSPMLTVATQRQHVWLLPATNSGGELVLPFFYPRQFVNILSAANVADLGRLRIDEAYPLNHASDPGAGALPDPVTIQIYAWMSDVELHGPTMGLALQSKNSDITKDEYDGVISGPASAVANVAGRLKDVPVIGDFATAAQIGATAIAKVSSLFGYSNTPVIEDVKPLKPSPFPHLASPEISYPLEKLSLDPKNELSIDPKLVGLRQTDEMNLRHLLTKESVIDYFTVGDTDTVGTLVWASRVNPNFYTCKALENNAIPVIPSPQAWLAQLFQFWRGGLVFKFKVICSQYHKGKLRISWDPRGTTAATQNIIQDSDSATAVKNIIMEIEPNKEVEFHVPYSQVTKWSTFDLDYTVAKQNAGYWNDFITKPLPVSNIYNSDYDNGTMTVRVFNQMVTPAPTSGADIAVIVSVRGDDTLEYAVPRDVGFANTGRTKLITYLKPQSKTVDITPGEFESDTTLSTSPDPALNLETIGEKVTNLRQLVRRTALWTTVTFSNPDAFTIVRSEVRHRRMPSMPGFSPGAQQTVNAFTGGAATPFGWAFPTHLAWIVEAYVGLRGSVNWTYNWGSRVPKAHVRAIRYNTRDAQGMRGTTTQTNTGLYGEMQKFLLSSTLSGTSGCAMTNQQTNAGLSISVPMYSNILFESTDRHRAWGYNAGGVFEPSPPDVSVQDKIIVEMVDTTFGVTTADYDILFMYCSAGSDFTLHYFLNAPQFYVYQSLPTCVSQFSQSLVQ